MTRTVAVLLGGLAASVPLAPPVRGQDTAVRTFRASADPVLSIGTQEGDSPYGLFQVNGAIRLSDGSVVVMAGGHYEVRRFGPDGTHLWSRGRRGEGPVEFVLPYLLPTCSSDDRIVIYDRQRRRVTILDNDGELVEEYTLQLGDRTPYSTIECSPSGRMVFTMYGEQDQMPSEPGPYRWVMDMAYIDGKGTATTFRSGIPGTDRHLYFKDGVPITVLPLTWGRDVTLAAIDNGVWIGTGDSHEIEFVDWTGTSTRRIQWTGPMDLEVTREDIDLHRERLYRQYERSQHPDWRQRFEMVWKEEEPALPSRFPSHNTIMVGAGHIWVKHFRSPRRPEHHWVAFDDDGAQVAEMFLPVPFIVQQIGPDWVLAVVTDDLGIQKVAVYGLIENP